MFATLHVLLTALNALWLDRLAHASSMSASFFGRGLGALSVALAVASLRHFLIPREPTFVLQEVAASSPQRSYAFRFGLRILVSGAGLACIMQSFRFIGPVVALLGRADAAFLAARVRSARPKAVLGLVLLAALTLYAAEDEVRALQGILLAFTGASLIAFSQLLMESEARSSRGALATAPALGLIAVGLVVGRELPNIDTIAFGAGMLMYFIYEIMRPLLKTRSVESCAYLTLLGSGLATPIGWALGWDRPQFALATGILGLLLLLAPRGALLVRSPMPLLARR